MSPQKELPTVIPAEGP